MIPLAEFIAARGRLTTAKLMGCTGPALANAMKAGRTIFVELAEDGSIRGVETSRFPGR
ncbi:Cro/CI family transcriptional regulator [Pseudomonas petrae]